MDDLAKILLTSSLTAMGAIGVFVFSQLLGKLVIEPVQDFKKLLGEVRYALVFHAQAILTPVCNKEAEDEAAKELRKLSCDLVSKLGAIPFYNVWANRSRGFLPLSDKVFQASKLLIGISNSVHQDNRSDKNDARISKIEGLLGFEPLDE